MGHGGWGAHWGGGYSSGPPPAAGLGPLGLSDASVHDYESMLQGVVEAGVEADLPSHYPANPAGGGGVTTLLLLHLRFAYGVSGNRDLPPIWEVAAQGKLRI